MLVYPGPPHPPKDGCSTDCTCCGPSSDRVSEPGSAVSVESWEPDPRSEPALPKSRRIDREHGTWQCPRCIADMVQGGVLHHELLNMLHALRFGLMNRGQPPKDHPHLPTSTQGPKGSGRCWCQVWARLPPTVVHLSTNICSSSCCCQVAIGAERFCCQQRKGLRQATIITCGHCT